MSYTKINKEITQYLKANNLPCIGNSEETNEETEERIRVYTLARDIIFTKWLEERKYRDLISCAHGGWYPEKDFFIPLAEHLAKGKDLIYLKFLCEREIKNSVTNMLSVLKHVEEDNPNIMTVDIMAFDYEQYIKAKRYNSIGEVVKWREKALNKLNHYIDLLQDIDDNSYREIIENIRNKVSTLSVKKSDMKDLNTKL